MKKHATVFAHFLLIITLMVLPGCGKIVDWVKDTLPQAENTNEFCKQGYEYVKSVVAYDQLTTVAKFDALWVSDFVRMAYVNAYCLKFGKSQEQKKALLRRQLEENNYYIVMYVLSSYEQPLGDASSSWTAFLTIDGKNYTPREVKAIDLEPEYICMFEEKYNRFKVPYIFKFDAKDFEGNSLITEETRSLTLTFRSMKKEVCLVWDVPYVVVHGDDAP